MEIIQIAGIGILATIIVIILKDTRPEFALYISIVTGVIIFSFVLTKLVYVIDVLRVLSTKANMETTYFSTIFKIIGIAYITEFSSQISKDAGEGSIAMKIELGGKVLIMVLAIPILLALMDLILKILP